MWSQYDSVIVWMNHRNWFRFSISSPEDYTLPTWVITCHANFLSKYLFMLAISSTFLIVVKFPRIKKLTISRFRNRISCSLIDVSLTLTMMWRVGRFLNKDLYLWSISGKKHEVGLLKISDINLLVNKWKKFFLKQLPSSQNCYWPIPKLLNSFI